MWTDLKHQTTQLSTQTRGALIRKITQSKNIMHRTAETRHKSLKTKNVLYALSEGIPEACLHQHKPDH